MIEISNVLSETFKNYPLREIGMHTDKYILRMGHGAGGDGKGLHGDREAVDVCVGDFHGDDFISKYNDAIIQFFWSNELK